MGGLESLGKRGGQDGGWWGLIGSYAVRIRSNKSQAFSQESRIGASASPDRVSGATSTYRVDVIRGRAILLK